MDASQKTTSQEPNNHREAGDKQCPTDDERSIITQQRLGRIEEFELAALDREDPYAAMIGADTANLQRIADSLGAAILTAMNSEPLTIERARGLSPDVKLLLRLRNAIQFDHELMPTAIEQSTATSPRKLSAMQRQAREMNNRGKGLALKRWDIER